MNSIITLYSSFLSQNLKSLSESSGTTPYDVNKVRYQSRGLFIAVILYLKYNPAANLKIDLMSEADNWIRKSFNLNNFFSRLIKNSPSSFRFFFRDLEINRDSLDVDIASLYENLLGIESGEENNNTSVKNYRNKLGSYYTPSDLAREVTTLTIDQYFKLNPQKSLQDNISFADFSCGAGNFLLEVIRYYKLNLEDNFRSVEVKPTLLNLVKNLNAFDVDPIALELAKLLILLEIEAPEQYEALAINFTHANFLLHTDTANASEQEKQEIFSNGYIYHERLALRKDVLKQYDIIIGNPPWEKIRFEKKKYFQLYNFLEPMILAEYEERFKAELERTKSGLKKDPFFSLSVSGELNTYALFTEAAENLNSKGGVAGLIIKSAVVTSQINQNLLKSLIKKRRITGIYDFSNTKKIFQIDSRERFCFLLLAQSKKSVFKIAMNLSAPEELLVRENIFELYFTDLKKLNPMSGVLPNFSSKAEAEFLLRVCSEMPFFNDVYKVKFGRIVHLNTHADSIFKDQMDNRVPIYEGKFLHQFNGRYAGFNEVSETNRYKSKASATLLTIRENETVAPAPESRYFIEKNRWDELSKNYSETYMLAWRSLTSSTNTRTCIATILPFMPAIQSVQFLQGKPEELLYLCGLFNSIVFDFIVRKKLSGIDLTQSIIKQVPVPSEARLKDEIIIEGENLTYYRHVVSLTCQLLSDDNRLKGIILPQFKSVKTNFINRFDSLRKLDLLFILLYGLNEREIITIVREFPKQYSANDLEWFLTQRRYFLSNYSIGTTTTTSSTSRPVS